MNVKELAERLSKQLNRQPNENLARQVIKFATTIPDLARFSKACLAFGRFDSDFLESIYHECRRQGPPAEENRVEYNRTVPKREKSPEGTPVVAPKKIKSEYSAAENNSQQDDDGPNVKVTFKKAHATPGSKWRDGSRLSATAQSRLEQIRAQRDGKRTASTTTSTTSDWNVVKKEGPEGRNDSVKREERYFLSRTRDNRREFRRPKPEPEEEKKLPESDDNDNDQDDEALDRDWYTGDDYGHAAGDEMHNLFYGGSYDAVDEMEMEQKMQKRISSIARQRQKDSDKWEHNRLHTSGVVGQGAIDTDFSEEQSRVHVFVHTLTPPFLDGHQVFTRQKDPISAVRDPESDLAQAARRGSTLVSERRQLRERQKQARDAASMAGTALGNVLGIEEEDDPSQNPSSNKYSDTMTKSSHSSKSLKEQRQFLPAFAVREDLVKVIRDNQVVVVVGETGSGKTTQLTQYLYEEGYGTRGIIGCTQPRRVAAMSVAKRVSEEMEVKLGSKVGYSIRFEDVTSSETIIKYMTEGVLLRESLDDSGLDKYSCIIMDEAHERSVNTDILLGLFKSVLHKRRDLKLIVTSATMNAERFSQFYGGAPQFTIPGRTYPVEIMYHHSPVEDYVDAAVRQVLSIHLQSGPGDILVFMTGQEDIEATCDILAERLAILDKPEPLLVLPIYSQMPADLQSRIFEPAPKGTRKVIVATNIAETSLTVDGISYVVDTGFSKLKMYNAKIGMDALQIAPISQANAGQRSGRAGRTGKGVAYRLYTERSMVEEMYPQTIPEIQRTNLSNTVLLLKSLGVSNLLEFDFLDPPPMDTMTASLYNLWALGALDNLGHLTKLGKKMSSFPMDPSLSKLVIMSAEYNCSEEMLTVVSMLSVPSVFYRPKERQEESDAAREKFFVPESDHLTLLNVYNQWKVNKYSDKWCSRHFLHSKSLKRAREVREQLLYIFESSLHTKVQSCGGDWDVVRLCICTGYFHQAAKAKGLGEFVNVRTNISMQLHPTSALYGLGYLPDFVVYHELILTSKQYMSTVTAVDPHWLAQFGGVFYSIKERGSGVSKKDAEYDYSERMRMEAEIERDRLKYEQELEKEKRADSRLKKSQKSAVVLPGSRQSKSRRRGI
uniref:Pre-mRNA-splicing factor ATP-dependent RNA helicase PRP16 n=1 Tax=Blastobotrys adeninivorans TaxID=409370 RepID=A0A060T7K3_BLAAD